MAMTVSETTAKLHSTITCPSCGHQEIEIMPTDACQYLYDCKGCGQVIRPKHGDCCVFCSYGSSPCPPIQAERCGASLTCCGPAEKVDFQSRDWLSSFHAYGPAWLLPITFFPLGLFASLPLRTVLWMVALLWMGCACLINAQRSGRTHCRFTGPYYLAMILPVLVLHNSSSDIPAWVLLGVAIFLGSRLLWWATERIWGKFSNSYEKT